MDSGYVYRTPDEKLCQGDIIRNLVHLVYKPPPTVLRRRDTKGGRVYEPYEYDISVPLNRQPHAPKGGFKLSEGDDLIAFGNLGMAIVLSHGCDIDKEKCKHWLVAPVRRLEQLAAKDQ